jgi:hypothetical protein
LSGVKSRLLPFNPVLEGFGDVGGGDTFLTGEVGDGPGDFNLKKNLC